MRRVMDRWRIPDCIRMLDGSLIRLTEMPDRSSLAFTCRKKYPATNVQAIVDHKKRFTSIELGWPGSASDVTMWKQPHVWQHRLDYFKNDALLLADETEIEGQLPTEKARRRKFNKRLSSQSIAVEHIFGMLEGRFPGLKDLPPARDIRDTYRIV
ncbi:hypothetical protein BDR04DRAFT_1209245, partial [Suillus decipiens]